VPKGTNELTLLELRELVHATSPPVGLQTPAHTDDIALSYYTRVAFSCAPIALALFALAVVTQSRVYRLVLGAVVLTAYFGYLFALDTAAARGWSSMVTPPVASWLPNLAVIALSISLMASRRPSPYPLPPRPL
jgi:lipopolysaccharide export LptBFGC system permease protein LptF